MHMRVRSYHGWLVAGWLVAAAPATAHDAWLEVRRSPAGPGERMRAHLYVGDHLEPELELPFEAGRTPRFELCDATGRRDLSRMLRRRPTPVLDAVLRVEGDAVLVMDRAFGAITHAPGAFRDYVEHEGFRGIAVSDSATAIRERYARCVKALARGGPDGRSDLHRRPFGQRMEILLLSDPRRLAPGDSFMVELRFEGRPLAGHAIAAFVRGADRTVKTHAGRTDASGCASLPLPATGLVMVRAVHMVPSEAPDQADWDSWWTSLSFEAGAPSTRRRK